MSFPHKTVWILCVLGAEFVFAAPQVATRLPATIRRVAVLQGGGAVSVEISSDQPVAPQTQVLSGPDRLVLDFPNALPGSRLHGLAVNRSQVRAVRVGLFAASPPVTRVVLDLSAPQDYRLFHSGSTVIVRIGSAESAAGPSQPAPPVEPPFPAARVQVTFQSGLLGIETARATLAEVLYEVHRQTGAEIAIPAGAEQEQVAVKLGPGPAREVLAALLNGSRFNFIMLGSDQDPGALREVILSPKYAGASEQPAFPPPTLPAGPVRGEPPAPPVSTDLPPNQDGPPPDEPPQRD